MRIPKLLLGLTIGVVLAALVWYWQKSTSAEDGEIDFLDKLAGAERRIRELERELRQRRGSAAEMAAAGAPAAAVASAADASAAAGAPAATPQAPTPESTRFDNLEQISGIGPVYATRLHDAGVRTFAALAATAPERLREIVGLQSWHSADPQHWVEQARELGG